MSWGEIKNALNSTVGTDDFESLDNILINNTSEESFYPTTTDDTKTTNLISTTTNITNSTTSKVIGSITPEEDTYIVVMFRSRKSHSSVAQYLVVTPTYSGETDYNTLKGDSKASTMMSCVNTTSTPDYTQYVGVKVNIKLLANTTYYFHIVGSTNYTSYYGTYYSAIVFTNGLYAVGSVMTSGTNYSFTVPYDGYYNISCNSLKSGGLITIKIDETSLYNSGSSYVCIVYLKSGSHTINLNTYDSSAEGYNYTNLYIIKSKLKLENHAKSSVRSVQTIKGSSNGSNYIMISPVNIDRTFLISPATNYYLTSNNTVYVYNSYQVSIIEFY